MVASTAGLLMTLLEESSACLWSQTKTPPPLSADRSLTVITSLVLILLLGVFLLLLISYGARVTRRTATKRFPASVVDEDEWYRKPLVDELTEEPKPDSKQDDDE